MENRNASTAAHAPTRARRILGWLVPLLGAGIALVVQVLIPRLLQMDLSDGEYTAFVAISAIAMYVNVADAGIPAAVVPELTALHGSGQRGAFLIELRRAGRVFAITAILGGIFAAIMLRSGLATASASWAGGTATPFALSAVALIAANTLLLALGNHHAILLLATGRLVQAQLMSLAQTALPLGSLLLAVIATRNLTWAIAALAAATALVALLRFVHARWLLRRESDGGGETTHAGTPLLGWVTTGVALRTAGALPVSAYPHALTVLSTPLHVAAVIPARTYANGCKIIGQQFVSVLAIYVTRKLVGDETLQAQGRHAYRVAGALLAGLHLLLIAAAAALLVPIFRLWLPHHVPVIRYYLPGLLAEQALLAAALPSIILYTARNRLRALGLIQIAGSLIGLAGLPVLLTLFPRAGYGLAFVVAAIPWFIAAAWSEHTSFRDITGGGGSVTVRYVVCALAALGCGYYAAHPWIVTSLVSMCSAALLPRSLFELWAVFFRGGLGDQRPRAPNALTRR